MEDTHVTLRVLPAFQLKLMFPNGSEAVVDLKHRVNGIRFGRLAEPGLFSTARIENSEVVWDDGSVCIRASINELLDSMQMDV